tara:strand:+ start:211 stop:1470 length:1260 start_codon:yes stop_codon:yes gene_type:complete
MDKKFDVVIGNPPFQNSIDKKKTQHKLWIPATFKAFDILKEDGHLLWITPTSWGSPSNKILKLMQEKYVCKINFDIGNYFSNIGSTFCYYNIINNVANNKTIIHNNDKSFLIDIGSDFNYIPNDFCEESISIHKKVIFDTENFYDIQYDYVNCHNNIILQSKRKNTHSSLSHIKTESHIYPVFHTNNKIWYSEILQDFALKPKVMWSRSGYVKPFFNDNLGCTDMGYFILVDNKEAGDILVHNLDSSLFKYIFKTAKWSGFNSEKLFQMLPELPNKKMSDLNIMNHFNISKNEQEYIYKFLASKNSNKNVKKQKVSRNKAKSDEFGEVFTPPNLVSLMLDELPQYFFSKNYSFIDPFCGTGNFLVEVIKRKIKAGVSKYDAAKETYGAEIDKNNIKIFNNRVKEISNRKSQAWCQDMLI